MEKEFLSEISTFLNKEAIYTDDLNRIAWGTDAGFYRLVPKIVIRSSTEEQIANILKAASENNIPVTFRAAGTSLSGQSVSDSVLVVAGKNWEKMTTDDEGQTVTIQPGVVGSKVNDFLSKYGRKFGPDPASIKSCMVGGIIMNNASGMSCGTWANSDRMLISARLVFADGTILDTADEASKENFRKSHPDFLQAICALRDKVTANEDLVKRIKHKYSIKNVTGLNILPLVTYTDPFEIILHLMAGSEGTLAFLSEARMKTLKIAPLQANAMVYFKDMAEAARAVIAMKELNVSAAEMLDKRSLASVNAGEEEGLTAVLTQTQAENQHQLADNVKAITDALAKFETYGEVEFTSDPKVYNQYWAIRSGIFPTVGGMRKPGTTCLIEDVAFHVEDLAEAVTDLTELLDRHGYDDSCIYGHALEGNFHFIINQAFDSEKEVERYKDMINDVGKLVVKKYDGSLKAEHGTGRNMAPFVEYEWGTEAYEVMKEIKRIFDPCNLLNPGVIFNDDPECCYKNFKALPVLHPADSAPKETVHAYKNINKCIECGFCETNCVSCGFTMSSRTRIVLQREIERLTVTGENPYLLNNLKKQYSYSGEQTCAGDGLCSISCPMGINVGDLTHEIRRQSMNSSGKNVGRFAADNFHQLKGGLRSILHLADLGHTILGSKAMGAVAKGLHAAGLPLWTPALPKAYNAEKSIAVQQDGNHKTESNSDLKVVYFPSCINQTMGTDKASKYMKPLVEEMVELMQKAGYEVIFPKNMDSLCCGTIWESKGLPKIADNKAKELEEALWEASEHGKYPVVCDQSPCLHRMKKYITKVQTYDSTEFIWKFLKDRLTFVKTDRPVALHLTCSTKIMKIDGIVRSLAMMCSDHVLVPEGVGCCGFAGDKGMTHPELNAYALRKLRKQIQDAGIQVGYSNSRTCEIGLQNNSGVPYMSIIYLVNRSTSAHK